VFHSIFVSRNCGDDDDDDGGTTQTLTYYFSFLIIHHTFYKNDLLSLKKRIRMSISPSSPSSRFSESSPFSPLPSSSSSTACTTSSSSESTFGEEVDMMNEDHNRTNDVLSLLRETERCFLRKQYSRSLILIDRYFRNKNISKLREQNEEISSGTTNVIRLFPSIILSLKNKENNNDINENENEKSFTFVATVLGYGEESQFISSPSSSSSPATKPVIIDRLAGLGLQSWHEQQRKKNTSMTAIMKGRRRRRQQNNEKYTAYHSDDIDDRWMQLMEILDYYDNKDENENKNINKSNGTDIIITSSQKTESHISLYKCRHRPRGALSSELLSTIWIPFWEYHGYELQAFMWTIQVLHYYSPSKLSLLQPPPASSTSTTTIEEELWMRCVCQQLPQHSRKNSTLAKLILGIITEKKDYVVEGFEFERIWNAINTDDNDGNSVTNSLLETLDSYLNDGTATSTSINDNNHDNSLYRRHPSHRGLGVSSRTLVKARDWLLLNGKTQQNEKQQHNRQHHHHHHQQQQKQQNPQRQKELSDINARISNEPHQSLSSSMTNSDPRRVLVDFLSRSFPFSFVSSIQIPSSSSSFLQRPINTAIIAIDAAKMIISRVVKRYLVDVNDEKSKKKWMSQFIQPLYSSLSPSSSSYSSNTNTTTNNNDMYMELHRQRFKQIIFSVVLVLIGWRRRGFLVRSGKALAWAILAPLRELLDALEIKPLRKRS
jgi:hypothetical protein